jgi:hypothetical protein
MPKFTLENIEDVMTYHTPDGEQKKQHQAVNDGAIEFARVILEVVPESAEQTLAIRAIQEVRFWANSAIAHKGKF